MKVLTQSVNFTADKDLIEFVKKKVEGLDKFHDKIVDAEIFLKVQQTSEKENKLTELKLNVPGHDFMIKKEAKTFEEGISLCVESMKRHLKKTKEKQRELQH